MAKIELWSLFPTSFLFGMATVQGAGLGYILHMYHASMQTTCILGFDTWYKMAENLMQSFWELSSLDDNNRILSAKSIVNNLSEVQVNP